MRELSDAVGAVAKCFPNFRSVSPPEDSFKTVYDAKTFKEELKHHNKVDTAIPVGWINEMFTTLAGVPYNKHAVMDMSNHVFAEPAESPFTFEIAVPDEGFEPHKHKGAVQCISPE